MTSRPNPQLSKTRFMSGLQCLKRLYLECFNRDLTDPVSRSQQALFDTGTAMGELARDRFPNGLLIETEFYDHSRAAVTTRKAVADSSIPAIYEAGFTFSGIRTRIDILRRVGPDEFDLIEVKSSTSVKDEHIPDVAIQLHVLEGSGIAVNRAYLMHVDNTYVYQGGPYDLNQLFKLEDVTDRAHQYLSTTVTTELARMWDVLQENTQPAIDVGSHCNRPHKCSFFEYCHEGESDHDIRQLPRANAQLLERLKTSGVQDIRDIPSGLPGLSDLQQRVRHCVVSGQAYAAPGLGTALAQFQDPVHFMDFETIMPALPLYPGTRPYQRIPFQWSLHIREASEQLRHKSFLQEQSDDPREAFINSLLDGAGQAGTIVVYSSFEESVIKQLADAYPQYKDSLLSICGRITDLYDILRRYYYHPEFHGSYSLKSVLPALVPQSNYDDLDIQEGQDASAAFIRMISPFTSEHDRAKLRASLLAYCQKDTEALVQVCAALS